MCEGWGERRRRVKTENKATEGQKPREMKRQETGRARKWGQKKTEEKSKVDWGRQSRGRGENGEQAGWGREKPQPLFCVACTPTVHIYWGIVWHVCLLPQATNSMRARPLDFSPLMYAETNRVGCFLALGSSWFCDPARSLVKPLEGLPFPLSHREAS